MPLSPITPRAPVTGGNNNQLSCKFDNLTHSTLDSPGKASLTAYIHLFCLFTGCLSKTVVITVLIFPLISVIVFTNEG